MGQPDPAQEWPLGSQILLKPFSSCDNYGGSHQKTRCPSHLFILQVTACPEESKGGGQMMCDGRNREWLWATVRTGDRGWIANTTGNPRHLTKKKTITTAWACHGLSTHLLASCSALSPLSDLAFLACLLFVTGTVFCCLKSHAHCEDVIAIEVTSL